MIQIATGRVRRHRNGDETEFLDATRELFQGFHRLLHCDERDSLETPGVRLAIGGEPGVVRVRDGAGDIMVFEKRQAQEHGRAEIYRGIDSFQIHVFQSLHRIEHAGSRLRSAGYWRRANAAADAARLRPNFSFQ